jgi:hypothetical protein
MAASGLASAALAHQGDPQRGFSGQTGINLDTTTPVRVSRHAGPAARQLRTLATINIA